MEFVSFRYNAQNMIIAALWCGRDKPSFKIFLKAFTDEISHLQEEGNNSKLSMYRNGFKHPFVFSIAGFEYEGCEGALGQCKVQVLEVIADLPAKAQLLNQMQYNGNYGCSVSYPGIKHHSN